MSKYTGFDRTYPRTRVRQQRVAEMERARMRGYAPRRREARTRRVNRRFKARLAYAKFMAKVSSKDTKPVLSQMKQSDEDPEVAYRVFAHASTSEAIAHSATRQVHKAAGIYMESTELERNQIVESRVMEVHPVTGATRLELEKHAVQVVPGFVRMPDVVRDFTEREAHRQSNKEAKAKTPSFLGKLVQFLDPIVKENDTKRTLRGAPTIARQQELDKWARNKARSDANELRLAAMTAEREARYASVEARLEREYKRDDLRYEREVYWLGVHRENVEAREQIAREVAELRKKLARGDS